MTKGVHECPGSAVRLLESGGGAVGRGSGGGGLNGHLWKIVTRYYILCLALVGRERKEDITSRVRRYNYYCHEL